MNDGYICHNLSVEQLSSVRMEDLPKGLLLKVMAPLELSHTRATLRREGLCAVHMYHYSFKARLDVSGSSFRVNLGTVFAPLLHGEAGRINVVFKVSDGCFEMLYKQDEEVLYRPQIGRTDYRRGYFYCSSCGTGFYRADICPNYGTKKRKKGNNEVCTLSLRIVFYNAFRHITTMLISPAIYNYCLTTTMATTHGHNGGFRL